MSKSYIMMKEKRDEMKDNQSDLIYISVSIVMATQLTVANCPVTTLASKAAPTRSFDIGCFKGWN